eukprot:TRINITY_DN5225_c0_g2_i1.p1 TRINITY_DN5225_c0_g2~~TRINITY_DN5225_c0_g2_i1.p1  ORF type:complete len:573 (+),score=91.25 TRINITY_DN5225_c0_g2_i1:73-1791(+)
MPRAAALLLLAARGAGAVCPPDDLTPTTSSCTALSSCTDHPGFGTNNCNKAVSGGFYCSDFSAYGTECEACTCKSGCEDDHGDGTPLNLRPRAKSNPLGSGTSANGAHALTAEQRERILWQHNYVRKYHGACPLEWDENIVNNIINRPHSGWATCSLEHSASDDRRDVGGFTYVGENLASASSSYFANNFPVDLRAMAWYLEETDWDYSTNAAKPGGGQVGHFTAMVWKSTTHVGCYMHQCDYEWGKKILLICQYGPGGNIQGQYSDNVLARATAPSCTGCSGSSGSGSTPGPTAGPSGAGSPPTMSPTAVSPESPPTASPTSNSTGAPTASPANGTSDPTAAPSPPEGSPTKSPVLPPTAAPTAQPTRSPTGPSQSPVSPTSGPTGPTAAPSSQPTAAAVPTLTPTTDGSSPTLSPSLPSLFGSPPSAAPIIRTLTVAEATAALESMPPVNVGGGLSVAASSVTAAEGSGASTQVTVQFNITWASVQASLTVVTLRIKTAIVEALGVSEGRIQTFRLVESTAGARMRTLAAGTVEAQFTICNQNCALDSPAPRLAAPLAALASLAAGVLLS